MNTHGVRLSAQSRSGDSAAASIATASGLPFTIAGGEELRLRPIREDDHEGLRRAFARLTPEQVRQRAFHGMAELSADAATRLARVSPEQGSAWVAIDAAGEIRAEARLHLDASGSGAEFALVVDPGFTGRGVGRRLMRQLLGDARSRGLRVLWGEVLADNAGMLELARGMGAERHPSAQGPGVVQVRFPLAAPCA